MRPTQFAVLASIALASLAAAPASWPTTTRIVALPNAIQDPRYHFEVRYPAGWERNKDDAPGTITLSPPAPNPTDTMPCILLCAYPLSDLPNVHNADDFKRHERDLISNSGGKIKSERSITLDGHTAYEFIFEIADPQTQARTEVVDAAFIHDNVVFGASLNGLPEQLEKFSAELSAIRASFHTPTPK